MADLIIKLREGTDINETLQMRFHPDYHYDHNKSDPPILIELSHSKYDSINGMTVELKEEDIKDLIGYLESVLSNFQQIDFSRYQPK